MSIKSYCIPDNKKVIRRTPLFFLHSSFLSKNLFLLEWKCLMPASPQKVFTQSAAFYQNIFIYTIRENSDIIFLGNNNSNIIYTCRIFSFICPPFASQTFLKISVLLWNDCVRIWLLLPPSFFGDSRVLNKILDGKRNNNENGM